MMRRRYLLAPAFLLLLASCAAPHKKPEVSNLLFEVEVSRPSTVLGFMHSMTPSCESRGYPDITIIKPPAHGELLMDVREQLSNLPFCQNRKVEGVLLTYRPEPDFSGKDDLTIEIVNPRTNTDRLQSWRLVVR